MDPNPKTFPILSYVMGRLPTFRTKPPEGSDPGSFDIEQPPSPPSKPPSDPSSSSMATQLQIVDELPRLADPKLLASMTRAVADVAQTRSVLRTIGDRPDHETVDAARAKLADIEANLAKQLEELVLSPRPAEVERGQWRAQLAEKESECRRSVEKEKEIYKAVIQLDEMHEAYEKLLKDAEERLVKIYDSAEGEESAAVDGDEVNEEVVGILKEASGTELERVDLCGRQLRFLPEAFGRIRGLRVLNVSSNQLEVSLISSLQFDLHVFIFKKNS